MNDSNNHYDFDSEAQITGWRQISCERFNEPFEYGVYTFETVVDKALDGYLAWQIHEDGFTRYTPVIDRAYINGKLLTDNEICFVSRTYFRYAYRVKLNPGDVITLVSRSAESDPEKKFDIRIVPPFTVVPPEEKVSAKIHVKPFQFPEAAAEVEVDLTTYTPGLGHRPAPGRFGFKKGDGVLDCAIPMLGVVDKGYLSGHPDCRKPFKWTCRFYPEDLPLHGSWIPAQVGIKDDDIEVNYLAVKWQSGDFCCRYSLGSPGVVFSDKRNQMTLSMLQYAGNYRYMLIPDGNDFLIRNISDAPDLSKMTENFIVLFGATEFPDVPIMLMFDQAPDSIKVDYTPENRLSRITFNGVNRIIYSTPLGIESPAPISPNDTKMLSRLIGRCRFWSHALLAHPVEVKEYFRCDDENKCVHIVQKFKYIHYTDSWNTKPLEIAVYPPVTTLSPSAKFDSDAVDFEFPSKYGYLRGRIGNTSSYTLDDMPTERKFPLAEKSSPQPEMDEFFKFHENFPHTVKSYPYAGALLEQYALPSTLMFFMKDADRDKISDICRDRLNYALEENYIADYTVIRFDKMLSKLMTEEKMFEVYRDPKMRHIHPCNWFDRREPFTGATYNICYLNVWLFSYGWIKEGTKEEVLNLNMPLIENDWGAGLTFYYIYLSSLCSGSFAAVKKNWKLLNGAFDYFRNMCDYACMSSAQTDVGICWTEGANYGAFTGFVNMAKVVGDLKTWREARYFAAKQMALRLAIFQASQNYFYKYFNHDKWYTTKMFHEEQVMGRSFQSVPDLTPENWAMDGVYNMTTEGLYPEIFDAYRKYVPGDVKLVAAKIAAAMRAKPAPDPISLEWTFNQCCASMLMMDDSYLEEAEKLGRIFNRWRGIHIFSRYMPEKYFNQQILAWRKMKTHPLCLTHWQSMKMLSAKYIPEARRAEIEFKLISDDIAPMLRFELKEKPKKIMLAGKQIKAEFPESSTMEIAPSASGLLEIEF